MEKAKELIDELVMTKKALADGVGVSPQLLYEFEKGRYKGNNLRKRIAQFATEQADRLRALAGEVEPEAETA
jgi:DNA-binding XRE family transcriptional regulator